MTLKAVPSSPQDVCPVLVGTQAPSPVLARVDGTSVELMSLCREMPTVLVFYRGGW